MCIDSTNALIVSGTSHQRVSVTAPLPLYSVPAAHPTQQRLVSIEAFNGLHSFMQSIRTSALATAEGFRLLQRYAYHYDQCR